MLLVVCQLNRDVIGYEELVMSLVRFDPSIRDFQIRWRDGNENVA